MDKEASTSSGNNGKLHEKQTVATNDISSGHASKSNWIDDMSFLSKNTFASLENEDSAYDNSESNANLNIHGLENGSDSEEVEDVYDETRSMDGVYNGNKEASTSYPNSSHV